MKNFFNYANGMDAIDEHWFMQDGAPPHRVLKVFDLINEYYDERVIALYYPHNKGMGIDWPPYSPDLNACDFFLWGYLKDRVYKEKIRDMDHLKERITEEINSIQTGLLRRVVSNFQTRCCIVAEQNGSHCENILKKATK